MYPDMIVLALHFTHLYTYVWWTMWVVMYFCCSTGPAVGAWSWDIVRVFSHNQPVLQFKIWMRLTYGSRQCKRAEFLVVKSTDYMRMQGHADASKCTAIEAFPEACWLQPSDVAIGWWWVVAEIYRVSCPAGGAHQILLAAYQTY